MAGNAEGVFLNALFATKWAEIKALWWLHRSNPLVSLSPLLPRRMNPSESHNYIFAAGHWDTPRHPTQNPPRRAPNASLTGSPCGTSITVKHSAPPGKLAILCFPSHTHQPLHPTTTAPAPFVRPLTLAVLNWAKSKFNISRGGWEVGLGCLKSSLQRAARVITAVTYAPVKTHTWLHSFLLCCDHAGLFETSNCQISNANVQSSQVWGARLNYPWDI